jgi:hypothetical protein
MGPRGSLKARLSFMAEGIEVQEGFNWHEYQDLCEEALTRIECLEEALYEVVKRTPFKASATGITAEISFATIKQCQAALHPRDPGWCDLELGDRVRFAHNVGGAIFTVATLGRHPIWEGGDYWLELDQLPGQFAPHLFRKEAP